MSRYVLDTNVFIQARNQYYGMDFCPGFWDWLLAANRRGTVHSIEAIFAELTPTAEGNEGEDELAKWARGAGRGLFLPHDAEMASRLTTVAVWANERCASGRYRSKAIAQFLGCADYFLIAHALAHGHTVVTHETTNNSPKRIMIPDACAELGVECARPFGMLRREGAKFVMQLRPDDISAAYEGATVADD